MKKIIVFLSLMAVCNRMDAGFGSWIRHTWHHATDPIEHHVVDPIEHHVVDPIVNHVQSWADKVQSLGQSGIAGAIQFTENGVVLAGQALSHADFLNQIGHLFPSCASATAQVPLYAVTIVTTEALNQALGIVQNDLIPAAEGALSAAQNDLNAAINAVNDQINDIKNGISTAINKVGDAADSMDHELGNLKDKVGSEVSTIAKKGEGFLKGALDVLKGGGSALNDKKQYATLLKQALDKVRYNFYAWALTYNLLSTQVGNMKKIGFGWSDLAPILTDYQILPKLNAQQQQTIQAALKSGAAYTQINLAVLQLPDILIGQVQQMKQALLATVQPLMDQKYVSMDQFKQLFVYEGLAAALNAIAAKFPNQKLSDLVSWQTIVSVFVKFNVSLTPDQIASLHNGINAGKVTAIPTDQILQSYAEEPMLRDTLISGLKQVASDPNFTTIAYSTILCQIGVLHTYYASWADLVKAIFTPVGLSEQSFSPAQVSIMKQALGSGTVPSGASCTVSQGNLN